MKIVQSLWSKPSKSKGPEYFSVANKCGWPAKKYNYISWTLSCLQFRKFYDEVELVTDKEGYDLLINKLELPYTSVKIVLDELNHYHPDLYALGKIHAYSLQDKPFIHADGDVIIWERFDKKFEGSDLLCQNMETSIDYNRWYMAMFLDVVENLVSYPDVLDESIGKNNRIMAVNAGILGGNNISFFKEYAKEAVSFVDQNTSSLDKIKVPMYNLVFEQFLFYALAEQKEVDITCYNPAFIRFWNDISDLTMIPSRTKYNHMMGILKRTKYTIDALEDRLQNHHPAYYYRLINLLKTNQI